MLCDMLGVVKLCFVCRAVGCIFGELLNDSPLFPVSMLQIFVDRSDTHSKERELEVWRLQPRSQTFPPSSF